jgi:hypothetical protein
MITMTTLVGDRAHLVRMSPAGHLVSAVGATCARTVPCNGTRVSAVSLRPRAAVLGVRADVERFGGRIADAPVVDTRPENVLVPTIKDQAQDGPLSVRAWSPPV